jgi:heme oxygenase
MAAMPTILDRLRHETATAHARLEQQLDLLSPPLSRQHFQEVLRGFHGFHAAWEPRMEAALGGWFTPRRRLHLIRRDLEALGGADDLPPPPALELFSAQAGAWGSLYVVEGSTLGGALISKHLAGASWVPPAGLRYFSPYGRQTAVMWKSFRAELLRSSQPATDKEMIDAALATFAALSRCLPTRTSPASSS